MTQQQDQEQDMGGLLDLSKLGELVAGAARVQQHHAQITRAVTRTDFGEVMIITELHIAARVNARNIFGAAVEVAPMREKWVRAAFASLAGDTTAMLAALPELHSNGSPDGTPLPEGDENANAMGFVGTLLMLAELADCYTRIEEGDDHGEAAPERKAIAARDRLAYTPSPD